MRVEHNVSRTKQSSKPAPKTAHGPAAEKVALGIYTHVRKFMLIIKFSRMAPIHMI